MERKSKPDRRAEGAATARWAVGRASALGCALALGCGPAEERSPPAQAARAASRVALVAVARSELVETLEVTGTLSATERVVVAAKLAGRISALGVDLGSRVKKGDVLAQIEPTEYALRVQQAQALLLAAKASLGIAPDSDADQVDEERTPDVATARATRDETRRQRERLSQLVEKHLVGAAELDAASASAERAEAEMLRARQTVWTKLAALKQRKSELALAAQALTDTTVRAPIQGIVSQRNLSLGALVAPGSELLSLVRVDPMRLRVAVPERFAAFVKVGQPIGVLGEGEAALSEGTIARVSPILSEGTRTLDAEADIPAQPGLVPGAFVHAAIVTEARRSVLSVPASAVVVFAGLSKVLTIADGKVRELPVETGRTRDGRVELNAGVREGTFVIRDPGSLQNGDPVLAEAEGPHAEAR